MGHLPEKVGFGICLFASLPSTCKRENNKTEFDHTATNLVRSTFGVKDISETMPSIDTEEIIIHPDYIPSSSDFMASAMQNYTFIAALFKFSAFYILNVGLLNAILSSCTF